jgi:hypothetical protein
MSWAKYFNLGFGGSGPGSSYMHPADLLEETIKDIESKSHELYNYTPASTWTTTTITTTRVKPFYHPASYSKRWRR